MGQVQGVRVAVSAAIYAIDRPYDYLVPAELQDVVQPGMRVMVPFGAGNRRTEGLVLELVETPNIDVKLKYLLTVLDERPVLDEAGIQLALWMRERFFCTAYEAARGMLPAGLWFALRDSYRIAQGVDRQTSYDTAGNAEGQSRVLDVIWASEGEATLEDIRIAFGTKDPNPHLKKLVDAGILTLETSATRGIGDKTELIATLAMPAEEVLALVSAKRKTGPLRYAVIEVLCGIGSSSAKELCYFTGASTATLRSLEHSGLITLEKREVLRRVMPKEVRQAPPPTLNQEQQTAFDTLDNLAQGSAAVALLYGVTGSGKTQVYIALIRAALERGETAMVLVPEIALTPQILQIFTAQFGDFIAVLHSALRVGERYDEWKRVREGKAKVVIGTRSAVFAPLKNLGLIILDEEQEGSYKSENTPRYHARDIAKYRCVKENALLVLGSATPAVETMYAARNGQYHLVSLTRRFNAQAMPSVLISDMKEELRRGNDTSIGGLLQQELEANLQRGEQSILFLNRRGSSKMLSCYDCGEVPTCPKCSVHLTYHSANDRLMCHYCGYSQRVPQACPACNGAFQFIGTGTQRVQRELEALCPGVEILRMDTDTITAKNSHEVMLNRFRKEKIPILIGTQMVAKGLDFENVTLVGVIAADLALYVDSVRAGERTFSLLTQVVGRAGRGAKSGRAVIQTYTPDNEVIRYAAAQDYDSFYQEEITMRRLTKSPPYVDVFLMSVSGLNEGDVLRACMRLREALTSWMSQPNYEKLNPILLGPAQAPVVKVNLRYRYRLTLKVKNTKEVRNLLSYVIRMASSDKENKGVSFFIDVNPFD